MNENKTISEKEVEFCYHYVNTGNIRESAIKVGYNVNPEKSGMKLLSRARVSKELERLYCEKKKNLLYRAYVGYERLAFGSIADAVKLLYIENLDLDKLDKMDLFNISEIRRPKDGAMEIKFFDRLRALEKLEQANSLSKSDTVPFYRALENGVKVFDKNDSES